MQGESDYFGGLSLICLILTCFSVDANKENTFKLLISNFLLQHVWFLWGLRDDTLPESSWGARREESRPGGTSGKWGLKVGGAYQTQVEAWWLIRSGRAEWEGGQGGAEQTEAQKLDPQTRYSAMQRLFDPRNMSDHSYFLYLQATPPERVPLRWLSCHACNSAVTFLLRERPD